MWALGTNPRFAGQKIAIKIEASKDAGMLSRLHNSLMMNPEYAAIRTRFSGPPEFSSKGDLYHMQIADVLAYELYLDSLRTFYEPTNLRTRKSWEVLTAHSDRMQGFIMHLGKPGVSDSSGSDS